MRKNVVLEIYLDGDVPKVRCTETGDCEEGVPNVWVEKKVRWRPVEAGALWCVFFTAPAGPFKKNRRIFHPDQDEGHIDKYATVDGEFDYCVSYQPPGGDGTVYHSDPKIKVRDLAFLRPIEELLPDYHDALADRHRVLAEVQAEVQELHAELAERMRETTAGDDLGPNQSM